MSSTTDRRQRGQALAVFALFLFVLILAAALAFDGGTILVESRDQQNAADASAIGGARFLPDDTSTATGQAAQIATDNGFTNGVDTETVDIAIGSWSPGGGFVPGGGTGAIEVRISARRPAVFGAIIGRTGWDVSSRAVAVNEDTSLGPFALLSLDETACPGMLVEGSGVVTSNGNIQVNSSCTTGSQAFRIAGTGSLDLVAPDIGCNVVGGWSSGGGVSQNDCDPPNTGATSIPDPYDWLGEPYDWLDPPIPPPPEPMEQWDPVANAEVDPPTRPIPDGCPGSTNPAPAGDPTACTFGGSYAGQTWRLYPGYYPGGVDLGAGSFLLEPGVYFVGGGGFRAANVAVTSVDPGEDQDDGVGGGVLIFNSTDSSGTYDPGPVVLQGGTAEIQLWPLEGSGDLVDYDRMVIYNDRDVATCPFPGNADSDSCVQIHGGGSDIAVRGVIYAPTTNIFARGETGTLTLDQAIGSTFEIRGNGGTINVAYDDDFLPRFHYAGLVE